MKNLLIIALLIVGCANNTISNFSSVLIDIFIIDGKCKSIIYKYNNLQEENKKLVLEYEKLKYVNDTSDEILQDYEDRILDLSFHIDDEYRNLTICNGGKTTKIIY
jgi:hypothetical protein